jgi:hypothetical protein
MMPFHGRKSGNASQLWLQLATLPLAILVLCLIAWLLG